MKKLLIPIAIILTLMLIGIAGAVSVSVTCNPEVIPSPGGTTTITVTCDTSGSGNITVITPGGNRSTVSITIPSGGGSISKVYPIDFPPPASTNEVGEYEVIVFLAGHKYRSTFWVSFTVIPQTPLGVVAVIMACFAALGVKQVWIKKSSGEDKYQKP